MSAAVTAALCVLWPWVAKRWTQRSRIAGAIGAVVLCYAPGILLANLANPLADAGVAEAFSEATIPLAIPLMLFSVKLAGWFEHGRKAALSFGLATAAVVGAALALGQVFSAQPNHAQALGMLVGTYTGGTPNMMAVGKAIESPESLFVLLNAADTVMGGAYLLFLMTFAKPLLSRLYSPWSDKGAVEPEGARPEDRPSLRARLIGASAGAALAVVALAASAGASMLLFGGLEVAAVMLGLTTFGVCASLVERVRELPGTYELGEYLVLMFCVAIGVRTDIATLLDGGMSVFAMTAALMGVAILGHFVLAKLFDIDVDTLIVTSTAAVFGPPFVGPVCEAIGNRQVLLSGLTTGLVGYAVGNYLGVLVAMWLMG